MVKKQQEQYRTKRVQLAKLETNLVLPFPGHQLVTPATGGSYLAERRKQTYLSLHLCKLDLLASGTNEKQTEGGRDSD